MDFIFGALFVIATIIPLYKMLPAFGINALWSLVAVTGIGTVVLLWIMSMRIDELRRL